jgi:hypothetical protein
VLLGTFSPFIPFGLSNLVSITRYPFTVRRLTGWSRLACALYVLRYLTNDSVVVLHDFMPRIRSQDALVLPCRMPVPTTPISTTHQ